jgi:anti-sigma factor RsiW
VAFLTSLGSQLYAKTRVRLHLRRLYRGGGGAVRELRRLAGLLSSAASAPSSSGLQRQAPSLADGERTQLRELSQRISASSAQLVAAITAAPAAAAGVAAAWAATADVAAVEQELTAGLAAAQKQAVQLEASVAALGQEVQMLEGGCLRASSGKRVPPISTQVAWSSQAPACPPISQTRCQHA